jgi:hypothetical protein
MSLFLHACRGSSPDCPAHTPHPGKVTSSSFDEYKARKLVRKSFAVTSVPLWRAGSDMLRALGLERATSAPGAAAAAGGRGSSGSNALSGGASPRQGNAPGPGAPGGASNGGGKSLGPATARAVVNAVASTKPDVSNETDQDDHPAQVNAPL